MVAHEPQEALGVGIRMASRDLCAVAHVQPHLYVMLSLLLQVISLKVVNDGEVVNVLATSRDIPVHIATILLVEFSD